MTKPTCEKPMEGYQSKCGKPAKYSMTVGKGTILLCGVHARKYIKANQPWHKVTPLKKEA